MSDELLKVVVQKREMHTDTVVALELADLEGNALPVFDAGAHIDLHLSDELIRQYSLCGDPANDKVYRLGVLKDPNSRGGSIAVHENLLEGKELVVSKPRNLFPLDEGAQHSILIGGGIGITPMIAMAYELTHAGRSFELWYCSRSPETSGFLDELKSAPFADKVNLHFDSEQGGKPLNLDSVLQDKQSNSHVYVCGPTGFMEWVIDTSLKKGFADEAIHREFFTVDVEKGGNSFEVYAEQSDITVTVKEDESVADALKAAGVKVQVSCEQGTCGTCLCDVLEGTPEHRDVYLTDDEKDDNDQMTLCCSRSLSDRLVLDI
ncbi:PDR/VanB family oxidoreductase [Marinomonas mediterranea]|jgi:Flavodoxin reductases (ferredoxin-NADPH reductases) family 1|uniref:Phthalate 4,5-dioxygenase n=1 Tax=Marinomonas mediterranea (strain ATCC 700492 / JCM 21426 / NBRC 103028 / MMB-1) TaxID=717774 RepID=F2JV69_MARM1|nr:PDR/VanB family oxidoreductase [Marinomonas mediterranea]ADZ92827.1 Phthalate 4,5-dioxygenase [Marinomonas mediterranea MMB-1]WCN18850.1 2Fe-2S iron-sulfur cluster binding domain-containing protein [Marinomonas mediterranea MMB-1]